MESGELSGVRYRARRLGAAVVAVLLVAATLTATATTTSAESVSTQYKTDGVSDLIWAAEHFGYSSPAELQKNGVLLLRFLLVAAKKKRFLPVEVAVSFRESGK